MPELNLEAPEQAIPGSQKPSEQVSQTKIIPISSAATTTKTKTNDHSYITKLPTFADRGQAIAKRLESVKADPKYQALPEDKKARVREDLYNKYVPASYAGFHLPVPDKDTWVGATGRDTTLKATTGDKGIKLSKTYKGTKLEEFGQDALVGVAKAYDGIGLFGARVANKAFSKMTGLAQHMSHPDDSWLQKTSEHLDINIKRHLDNFIDAQHARLQSEDFWEQTHPRDTTVGKLGSMTGETLATLPLYEALSSIGAGAKLVEGVSKLSLTSKLGASPLGKFVAKRMVNATDAYIAKLAESGGSNTQAVDFAKGAAQFDSGMALAGKGLKIAAAPLIKKWTASLINEGGIPFAQDLAQSSMHEIEHEIAHTPDGERKWNSLERSLTKVNTEEINARREAFYKQREQYDPVMAKLHAGEKVSLNSVAQAKFGKDLNELSLAQRREAFAKRIELIHQAAQEAPVHLPEVYKEEVTNDIAKERANSPYLNNLLSALEKQGVNTTAAPVENGLATIAKETGISNTKGATKKLDKALKPVRSVGADLNKYEPDKSYTYAQYRGDTIANMRAPRNRARLAAATSDRSAAGLNKFIDTLKDATPGRMQFEDPAHLMLFHYGNAESLPSGFKETMQRRFKQLRGYENSTPASLRQEAGMMHSHLLTLAKSGKLGTEGNIFRSTKTQGPYSWTKWQTQLSDEAIAQTIKPAQQALRNHPIALKSFNTTINQLKKTRPNLKTAEDVIKFERSIADASTNIVSHVADKKLGGIIQ